MHNFTTYRLCTLQILTVPFHHSPLLQIEIQKRQFLKKFLSPPYRTKQGGKTKHLLKNLHFLQKVGAGFLLRNQDVPGKIKAGHKRPTHIRQ